MSLFLNTLKEGGANHLVELRDQGFNIVSIAGHEAEFHDLARHVMDRAGDEFTALPRPDGHGGYDMLQVIIHARAT